jgi:transposase-like protein
MSVSLVARQEGVSAGPLFQWRKLERQGALTAVSAGEAVVPASELAAARAEIGKLQRVLGKKTLENEILKEAVKYAAEKCMVRLAFAKLFLSDEGSLHKCIRPLASGLRLQPGHDEIRTHRSQ